MPALWKLWRESTAWRGRWVLVQYTGLGWARRGFPIGVLASLAILRRRGCRCAVVFHEFTRQSGITRRIDRIRGGCQQWVIEKLYRGSMKCIFTVPVERVDWLTQRDSRSAFIPIGANIPERVDRRSGPGALDQQRTVIVFGVTGAPRTAGEVEEIAAVMNETRKSFSSLRLVVIGRGSTEVHKEIETALAGSGVEVVVRGVLPADEIADEFARAHVLLFVRGAITLQRGSAIAGIACGLPIVGYRLGGSGDALDEAGIEWSPWRDRQSLVRALVRVLSDSARWEGIARTQLANPARSLFLDANRRTISGGTTGMTQRPLRVLIVASHPVQYASPIFRLLAQDLRVESEVAYCSWQRAEPGIDPGFGVEVKWDIPLLDGYQWALIRNRSWAPRVGSFFGLLNLGIWHLTVAGALMPSSCLLVIPAQLSGSQWLPPRWAVFPFCLAQTPRVCSHRMESAGSHLSKDLCSRLYFAVRTL